MPSRRPSIPAETRSPISGPSCVGNPHAWACRSIFGSGTYLVAIFKNEALKFLDQSGLRGVIACLRSTD